MSFRFTICALALCGFTTVVPAATFAPVSSLPGAASITGLVGVSGDGATFVGSITRNREQRAVRWTAAGGFVELTDVLGNPVLGSGLRASTDGKVIAGTFDVTAGGAEAFRWTSAGGLVALGDLPGGALNSRVQGMSADGTVIVGRGQTATRTEAFRWTAASGMTSLGNLPGAGGSVAVAASADGSVIAGSWDGHGAVLWDAAGAVTPIPALAGSKGTVALSGAGSTLVGYMWTGSYDEGYIWNALDGVKTLGVFGPMTRHASELQGSYPTAASADASVVVGSMQNDVGNTAFLWNAAAGIRSLKDVLIADYGLGAQLSGWILPWVYDVSADGKVMVGYGYNPGGFLDGWIADLRPAAPVPEPTYAVLLLAGLPLVGWMIRRRARAGGCSG